MSQPNPAIVAQAAVRRLPRWALLAFCLAYIVPGFVGREPWKNADMTAFGYMVELARGQSTWFDPRLAGLPPEVDALMPYWLGAWAIRWAPSWLAPDFAARLPFIAFLTITLIASWYAIYFLARSPKAQPVAFAFGGEAHPKDYARAIGDGGLLALIACLGLAQLAHETTPALSQACFGALTFCAVAALPYRPRSGLFGLLLGLVGLALSGAPSMALMLGTGAAATTWLHPQDGTESAMRPARQAWLILAVTLGVSLAASALDLWRWRLAVPAISSWHSLARLLLWFTWPSWPLVIWTLWRWRLQVRSRHIAWPLWFASVALATTLLTPSAERSLMVGLPAMACLAAFALPTLRRSVSALIDWFTLLFFTGCAFVIWVVWIAMQTGVPAQPAANVKRLAPGFEPFFAWLPFVVALVATLAWSWLVKWRAGRHRAALWKSMVLPAGGAALCWLLLMTLWMPLLDFARSYAPLVRIMSRYMNEPGCVEFHGLSRGQIAAIEFHGGYALRTAAREPKCPWLVVDADAQDSLPKVVDVQQWSMIATLHRPSDNNEDVLLFKRVAR